MEEKQDDGRVDYVTTARCAPVVAGHRIPVEGDRPRAGHPLRLFPREANYYLAQGMIEAASKPPKTPVKERDA